MSEFTDALQQTQILVMGGVMIIFFLWETVHPFYAYFNGSFRERGRHLIRNLTIGFINGLMIAVIFVSLWVSASVWADVSRFGLLHFLQDYIGISVWGHAVLAILFLDLWTYIWHRMNHEIHFFWRFHRVHHSDSKMDVTTASRFHAGEILFSSLLRIPLILLFGIYFWELLLYEIVMFAIVQFHHANIHLDEKYDRILRIFIVTPNMHRVHHSRWQPETDSNYSSLFSVWDRLARTFRVNPDPQTINFGLDEFASEDDQTITGMLKTPLLKSKHLGSKDDKTD